MAVSFRRQFVSSIKASGLLYNNRSLNRVSTCYNARRNLSLHEYISLGILSDNGLTIPRNFVAETPDEARIAAETLAKDGIDEFVIKAQVLAGGRGKGSFVPSQLKGGVKMAFSPDEVESLATKMLNNTLITKQTGAKGTFYCLVKYQYGFICM